MKRPNKKIVTFAMLGCLLANSFFIDARPAAAAETEKNSNQPVLTVKPYTDAWLATAEKISPLKNTNQYRGLLRFGIFSIRPTISRQ
jgi:hypothetical protein